MYTDVSDYKGKFFSGAQFQEEKLTLRIHLFFLAFPCINAIPHITTCYEPDSKTTEIKGTFHGFPHLRHVFRQPVTEHKMCLVQKYY